MKSTLPQNNTKSNNTAEKYGEDCPTARMRTDRPESDAPADALPPSCNTGGEKITEIAKITTFVDTFHFVWRDIASFQEVYENLNKSKYIHFVEKQITDFNQFLQEVVLIDKTSEESDYYESLLADSRLSLVQHFCKIPISLVKLGKGLHGYNVRFNLVGHIPNVHGEIGQGDEVTIGTLCLGGNKDTVLVQISGTGCPHIDFPKLAGLYERLNSINSHPRFTRIDIAADFHTGELTIEHAVEAYKTEQFKTKVQPTHSTMGDWLVEGSPMGRTLYVGSRKNSKMARIYEKGKQMGDPLSKWVRVEIEFKNADAVLHPSMITDTDGWFTGAYPWCSTLVQSLTSHKLKYTNVKVAHEIDHMVKHAKRCYGKVFNMLLEDADGDLNALKRLIHDGKPLKVTPHIGIVPSVKDIMHDLMNKFENPNPPNKFEGPLQHLDDETLINLYGQKAPNTKETEKNCT